MRQLPSLTLCLPVKILGEKLNIEDEGTTMRPEVDPLARRNVLYIKFVGGGSEGHCVSALNYALYGNQWLDYISYLELH